MPDETEDDDDDIVPGPLDEEDEGLEDEDDGSPLSNSVPGEDLPPDLDDGDPDGPKPEIKDPIIVDE
jgi:hypothetical protein